MVVSANIIPDWFVKPHFLTCCGGSLPRRKNTIPILLCFWEEKFLYHITAAHRVPSSISEQMIFRVELFVKGCRCHLHLNINFKQQVVCSREVLWLTGRCHPGEIYPGFALNNRFFLCIEATLLNATKTNKSPSRGFCVPWAGSLWHKRSGVASLRSYEAYQWEQSNVGARPMRAKPRYIWSRGHQEENNLGLPGFGYFPAPVIELLENLTKVFIFCCRGRQMFNKLKILIGQHRLCLTRRRRILYVKMSSL